TFDVMKAPSIDGDPLTPGIQTYQLVNTAGWHTELNNTASCCGSSHTTVVPAAPGLTTQASPPVTLGGQITDTANLTGGDSPTAPPTKPPTPAPTPTPSSSVLGASINKKPTLPVTGPSLPIGPLGLLGIALVAVGAALLRRKRRSGAP